ncbi:MAG: hypothetical protein CL610_12950 [Anaerolineaceae bacterium]|nr:hypothetical protein [Anaerolineaceae bacterium]
MFDSRQMVIRTSSFALHVGCGFMGSMFIVENYDHRDADPIVEMMKAGLIVGVYAVSSGWMLARSLKNKSASAQQIMI